MGQCYYMTLMDFHTTGKKWLDKITGTIYDPFYDDNNIGAFLERVYNELVVK